MATWVCANCGGDNPEGMKFCGHCGGAATAARADSGPDVADALRSFVAGPVADRLVESGGTLPEERRLITALFADVSGFTALADRLDPEQLLEVIDPVISGLSDVVGRYGGYVEKFAGDALMALFGAPVSHEDDAARAVRVALEMHTELARLVEDLPHEAALTLHVGINSGHGIARILGSKARMDYAVLGDSVILAQRLESAAPPGETYVSEATMQLTDGQFEFEPVGLLELKGKSQPVSAWRLLGPRSKKRTIPDTQLVGREAELARVAAYLESRHGVLTVTGEPGLGKSRLVDAARADAQDRGLDWLETRCLSYGAGLPYWPYTDLLRMAADRPADPHFDRLLGGDELAELEPEAFRRGLYDAFGRWLGRDEAIVAIEDLHWADPSTLALTGALARSGVNLLLSARPEADLADIPGERIELAPIGPESAAAIAAATLGGKPERKLETLLVERTGGNPFFVQELARALRDTGRIVSHNGAWRLAGELQAEDVPPTIEGVLAARIDLLHRSAAEALGTASVIGRRVRMQLLQAVAPSIETAALEDLVRAGLLDRPVEDEVAFHHALVQDVAYGRLLRRRRRELHLRVAEVAESLYGAGDDVVGLLARHLYLGNAGERASAYLVRAGTRAKQLFANDEAILHFQRAAEVAPDDADVTLALADLHELVGNYGDALHLYNELIDRTDDVWAWRGAVGTLRKQGQYLAALELLNDAFSAEQLKGRDLRPLWLEGAWTLAVCGRYDQAMDLAHVGIEVGAGIRDSLAGQLLVQLTRAETIAGLADQAIKHGLEAESIFEAVNDLRGLAAALRLLGDAYLVKGAPDNAVETLRRGLAIAERVGNVEELGGCLINLGLVELRRGDLQSAIAYDRRAIDEFERVAHGSGRTVAYANLAEMLTETGEFDEALEYCARALDLARSMGNMLVVADATKIGATIRLRRGELQAAATQAEEAGNLFVESGAGPYAAEAFVIAAEALAAAGHEERADELNARARSLT
jgi:adenylate cyclase